MTFRHNKGLSWLKILVVKRPLLLSVLFAITLFNHVIANAQSELSKESKLKAAYLLNFTLFISWPEQYLATPKNTIVICLQGSKEFVTFANDLAAGTKFSNRKKQVQVQSIDGANKCDLSYIQYKISTLPSQVRTSVIVVSSESEQVENTAITFFTDKRKLRFEISVPVMQKLGVSVSSELLKLAKVKP